MRSGRGFLADSMQSNPQSASSSSQMKAKFAKVLLVATLVGMAVAIAAQIIAVVAHYVVKVDIHRCWLRGIELTGRRTPSTNASRRPQGPSVST
jgi:hypothetical protein